LSLAKGKNVSENDLADMEEEREERNELGSTVIMQCIANEYFAKLIRFVVM
jgi:hypothetical protein